MAEAGNLECGSLLLCFKCALVPLSLSGYHHGIYSGSKLPHSKFDRDYGTGYKHCH